MHKHDWFLVAHASSENVMKAYLGEPCNVLVKHFHSAMHGNFQARKEEKRNAFKKKQKDKYKASSY